LLGDSDSWILPYAQELGQGWRTDGHQVRLCRKYSEVVEGDLAFFLGCIRMAPSEVVQKNRHNLVVHESDLPQGKGFAPIAWQVLGGKNRIPVVLVEAEGEPNSGPIYLRSEIVLEGHELMDEIRHQQGLKTLALCRSFVQSYPNVQGTPQTGESSFYRNRTPQDSCLDPDRTIREQFPLLRIVDNSRYPAYFEFAGHRNFLRVEKSLDADNSGSEPQEK